MKRKGKIKKNVWKKIGTEEQVDVKDDELIVSHHRYLTIDRLVKESGVREDIISRILRDCPDEDFALYVEHSGNLRPYYLVSEVVNLLSDYLHSIMIVDDKTTKKKVISYENLEGKSRSPKEERPPREHRDTSYNLGGII